MTLDGIKNLFWQQIYVVYRDIPPVFYIGLLVALILAAFICFYVLGVNNGGNRLFPRFFLGEYILLVFSSTIFFRMPAEVNGFNFQPFWSYYAFSSGKNEMLPEIIMNVAFFIPIGLLMACAFNSIKLWKVFCFGCSLSLMIEVFQFFLKRGLAETDDIIHNTLGCLIGYGIYYLVRWGSVKVYN